jgi:hypothetical protein
VRALLGVFCFFFVAFLGGRRGCCFLLGDLGPAFLLGGWCCFAGRLVLGLPCLGWGARGGVSGDHLDLVGRACCFFCFFHFVDRNDS